MPRLVYKKQNWKARQPFKHRMPRTSVDLLVLLTEAPPKAFKRDESNENLIRAKENPKPVKLTFIGNKKTFSLQATKVRVGTETTVKVVTDTKEVPLRVLEFDEVEILVR